HQIKQKAQSEDWAFCFICCLSVNTLPTRTNPPGADLNVAKQRPEGGGQDARHKLPDIKSSERPSERMAFLLFELTFN
ncbi:hypothetical protein ACR568_004182, partial [Escherichia coli]